MVCYLFILLKKKEKYLSIVDVFGNAESLYSQYLNDKYLLIYQKILLIYSNFFFLLSSQSINEYKESKLTYIKRKDIRPNSVFGKAFNFLKEFIEKRTPKSYLFYLILLLDSGIYETKDETSI